MSKKNLAALSLDRLKLFGLNLHSERPKLYAMPKLHTVLAFLTMIGLTNIESKLIQYHKC